MAMVHAGGPARTAEIVPFAPPGDARDMLRIDLAGFEGPIDLLLRLAREQKVDLSKLSILELANQYLAFITDLSGRGLEPAGDYLVMAAWLAYLKSRLLLPPEPSDAEEPPAEELAAALGRQLRRLAAMQRAGATLAAMPQFGRDMFGRGAPEPVPTDLVPVWEATLGDLLSAYAGRRQQAVQPVLRIRPPELFTVEDALRRLAMLVGSSRDWRQLSLFLPDGIGTDLGRRSALAATFVASLELARAGRLDLRQSDPFGVLQLRALVQGDDDGA